MASLAQSKAQQKYDKMNTRQIMLKLNLVHDSDILNKLNNVDNKQGYIKELIRNDMRNQGGVLSLDTIKQLLSPIVYKYEVNSLSIFGSYSRQEATPSSDVDILISGGNFRGLYEYYDFISVLENTLGRKVDVVLQSTLDKATSESDLLLRSNIERDKVNLF